jgi:hypothetical protein
VGVGNFSLHYRVLTGSGAHPASYPMGTKASFPGGEADHPLLSSAVVKNAWSYTSLHQYALMAWCSVKKSTGTSLPLPFTTLKIKEDLDFDLE